MSPLIYFFLLFLLLWKHLLFIDCLFHHLSAAMTPLPPLSATADTNREALGALRRDLRRSPRPPRRPLGRGESPPPPFFSREKSQNIFYEYTSYSDSGRDRGGPQRWASRGARGSTATRPPRSGTDRDPGTASPPSLCPCIEAPPRAGQCPPPLLFFYFRATRPLGSSRRGR